MANVHVCMYVPMACAPPLYCVVVTDQINMTDAIWVERVGPPRAKDALTCSLHLSATCLLSRAPKSL